MKALGKYPPYFVSEHCAACGKVTLHLVAFAQPISDNGTMMEARARIKLIPPRTALPPKRDAFAGLPPKQAALARALTEPPPPMKPKSKRTQNLEPLFA